MINGHTHNSLLPKGASRRGGRRGDDQWTPANTGIANTAVGVAEADAAMINGHR